MYSIQVGSKYPADLLHMNLATRTSRFRDLPFFFGPFFRSNIRTQSWKYCYLIWIRRHAPRPSLGLAWRMFCPKSFPSSPVRVSVSVTLALVLFSTCHHRDVSSLKWNLYRPIGAGDHRFPLEASQAECDDWNSGWRRRGRHPRKALPRITDQRPSRICISFAALPQDWNNDVHHPTDAWNRSRCHRRQHHSGRDSASAHAAEMPGQGTGLFSSA